MENSVVHTKEKNQKNDEKPPPRVCPRCNSGNTKFCYYNNYRSSQPRYFCKSCRRYWTHGGTMRKIPIGGRSHKRRTNISQPSASQVFSVNFQHQVHYHQPFFHIQANSENLISFDTSSSSVATTIGNHSNSLSMIHNEPLRFSPPIKDVLDFSKGSFQQDIFNTGSNHWTGNPLINQVIGRQVYNQNDYRMNQEDPNKWNQNFKSTINMSDIASTSGITRSSVMKKCIFGSFYHLKKHSL